VPPGPSSPPSAPPGAGGEAPPGQTVVTTYDGRGFLTTMTVPAGWTRGFDDRGFLAAAATAAPQLSDADAAANGFSIAPASGAGPASRRPPPARAVGAALLALGLFLYIPG